MPVDQRISGISVSSGIPLLALGNGVTERVYLLGLLDLMGVCANCDIRHTKKSVLNHFRDFETIEVLFSHLQKYSLQRSLVLSAASEPKP